MKTNKATEILKSCGVTRRKSDEIAGDVVVNTFIRTKNIEGEFPFSSIPEWVYLEVCKIRDDWQVSKKLLKWLESERKKVEKLFEDHFKENDDDKLLKFVYIVPVSENENDDFELVIV